MLDTQKEQADLQNFFNDLPQKKIEQNSNLLTNSFKITK